MRVLFFICLFLAFFTNTGVVSAQSFSLYLIGDAGDNVTPGETLQLLEFKLKNESPNSAVIFLGDNSYEKGLFPEDSKHREESEMKLQSQLYRVKDFNGQAYMIPGNHDWKNSRWAGLKQVQEEEKFVSHYWSDSSFHIKNPAHCFLPQAGFPGPVSILLDSALKIRLIAYDPQWWLQRQWFHKVGKEDDKSFKEMSDDFFISMRKMVSDANSNHEQIIIAAHQPLMTAGQHGVLKTVPYILATYTPLIIFRPMGLNRLFRQDITSNAYRRLADSMLNIIQHYSNIIYVSGHDHNLQLLRDAKGNLFIVSGAGSKVKSFAKHPSSFPLWENDTTTGFFQLQFNSFGIENVTVFTPQETEGTSLKEFLH